MRKITYFHSLELILTKRDNLWKQIMFFDNQKGCEKCNDYPLSKMV